MAAYLVCATSLYIDAKEARVSGLRLSRNLRHGSFAIKRRIDHLMGELELANDYCMICLGDLVRLENLYCRNKSRMTLGEHKASCSITIKPVHRLKGRYVLLNPQYGFGHLGSSQLTIPAGLSATR